VGRRHVFTFAGAAWAQLADHRDPYAARLPQVEKDASDPDATYCRPPQRQSDSRLLRQRVCLTNRQWGNLHTQGFDMSADGKGAVASEKYRTLQGEGCRAHR
jgi:hypothetical protein